MMGMFLTALGFEALIIILSMIVGFFLGKSRETSVTDVVTEAEILLVLRTLSVPLDGELALEAVRRIRDKGVLFREVDK